MTGTTLRTRPTIRAVSFGLAAALAAAGLLGACGSGSTAATTTPASTQTSTPAHSSAMADGDAMDEAGVHLHDAWVKAVDSGMTALFGVLENHTAKDVTLISATSPASPMIQLHETVSDGAGGTKMQEKQGGFLVKANGGQHVLAPGQDHIMLMGITAPLKAGTTINFVLTFSDGTTLKVTAPVKTFAAGQESYAPSGTTGTGSMPGMSGGTHTHG